MTTKTKTTTANGKATAEDVAQSIPDAIYLPERTEERLINTVEAIQRLERERNTILEVTMDALDVPEGWQVQRMADGRLAFAALPDGE